MEGLEMPSSKKRFKIALHSLYSRKQCEDESFVFDDRDKIIPKVKAFFECCGYEVLDKSVVFISDEVIYKDLFRALLIKKFYDDKDRYIKKTDKGEYFDDYLFLNTIGKIDNDVLEVEDLYSIYLGKSFRKGGYKRDWGSDEEFDYEYLGAVIRKHLCILAGENYQI